MVFSDPRFFCFFLGTNVMQTLEHALQTVSYEVLITSEPGLESKEWNRISCIQVVGFVA